MSENRTAETVRLELPGRSAVSLPVRNGSLGPDVLDIRKLYGDGDVFSFDPGFTSTASCSSSITYIDGEAGVLLYRGYPVSQLAEKRTFPEVMHLLLKGELPSALASEEFQKLLQKHTMVHQQVHKFYQGFRLDAHPMAIMVGVVGALSAFYHDSLDIGKPQQRDLASIRLIAKMPTLAAMAYKYSIGQPVVYPLDSLSFTKNFLHMMFSLPCGPYEVNPVFERALDQFLILHADHEQNASTSTVRLAGSSGANPFACIASGIACLWGPAHGGANEAALTMLRQIGTKDRILEFLKRARDPDDSFRLMGFGHRVYKTHDPRAGIMKTMCDATLEASGRLDEPLFQLAKELEKIALEDPYFVARKLYPNVDFYSGIMLEAIGIPTSMFTVLFSIARVVGWVAHWNEMITDPSQRIGRPRQLYVGSAQRDVP